MAFLKYEPILTRHAHRDQELRFIVHDSPDYQKVKISVFSEDKRTDLIGEAWVDLTQVIIPGGGKSDLWQNLTFKGKYAGELRIELTYYDERPKPVEVVDLGQSVGSDSRVKRRPLPSNPNNRHLTPDTIPGPALPGRAKHGPRDLSTPPRPNSMPAELNYPLSHPGYGAPAPLLAHPYSSPASQAYQTPPNQCDMADEQYGEPLTYGDEHYNHQEFLPQLPPSNRQRSPLPMPPRIDTRQGQILLQPRPLDHMGLQHSQSSPAVPTTHLETHSWDDADQLRTDFSEPIPDVEYQYQRLEARPRTSDASPAWQFGHPNPHANRQAYVEEENHAPPPPPIHSNSSPAVPQRSVGHPASSPGSPYGATPPSARHNSIPNSSPLQGFERKYGTPPHPHGQASPTTGTPADPYTPSPQQRGYSSSPGGYVPGQTPSPFARQQPPRPTPNRHSIADPYNAGTPPRPHPLSQEVPQTQSPPYLPGSSPQVGHNPPYPTQYRSREGLPLIKPRPISPQTSSQPPSQPNSAARSRSSYDIQFPVRAFESSDNSPLSTSQPNPRVAQLSNPSTPMRKSMSPHSTPPHSAEAMPYSPDSFNVHNPNAQPTTLPKGNSPHTPYQIRPGSDAVPRDEPNGPIVDSHGNEVDPSDRLPMNSWAPEPEKKTPTRTYGLGRDRDFGPRSPQSADNSAAKNLSKDTVVNFRTRAQTQPAPAPVESSPVRNRLRKKSTPPVKNPMTQPLQERHNYNSAPVPNPYEQQEYGGGFYSQPYDQGTYSGSYAAMSEDALSREISSIDIGGNRHGRSGSVPAPTAYVPVRSHRDRKTLF